jgi:hypothetical protein
MVRKWLLIFAVLCLAGCLAVPVFYLAGLMNMATYKGLLVTASIGWFILATASAGRGKRSGS